ncbi:peptide release factor 2 (mtRF2) [Andalucia godoyi]|uniref:Peptide release factor 2 (MtRF2) n=1 Tax=Andalucia godoyi TaxID=505711 RepID=A0A8K0F2Q9_ANDGO|nr:peptide release factor 2 (mtRF2) [Andalucia godoyi]|eukprot:ANDGO_01457.mRNA.1 mitochondrial peptide chain release factor
MVRMRRMQYYCRLGLAWMQAAHSSSSSASSSSSSLLFFSTTCSSSFSTLDFKNRLPGNHVCRFSTTSSSSSSADQNGNASSSFDAALFSQNVRKAFAKLDDVSSFYSSQDLFHRLEMLSKRISQGSQEDLWKDPEKAQETIRTHAQLESQVRQLDSFFAELTEIQEMISMITREQDASLEEASLLVQEQLDKFRNCSRGIDQLHVQTLLTGPYDLLRGCFLEIHAGAGGTESCDWTEMVCNMYQQYCGKSRRFSCSIVDRRPGETAGIKSVTLHVEGECAYGFWRQEEGVHRLVRMSPFDSSGKRHTSFSSVSVYPDHTSSSAPSRSSSSSSSTAPTPGFVQVPQVQESDLRIDTYRAGGAGGQHVNKTESAVRITHIPSGLVVTCQNERSQHRNKATAMAMLQSRLQKLRDCQVASAKQQHAAELGDNAFGNQIRSYVLAPYRQVKDLRTGVTITNPQALLDGDPELLESLVNAAMKEG